ncbi:SulP family inorganic anion transporter, partial [Acinetobacter baumannii]|uniref:SulP family inorganic anion transporter n=1 Tax=Acinetobacter baumannii TaxID=470 RepID=UPI001FF5D411
MLSTIREQWFSNIRGDVLAGIVVALALIPEAIAFSIIAGVDPKVGLYASFCIAVVISWHCCKVSDEAAFCLIQRPYISKTLLT